MRTRFFAFTLVELMVTVSIFAIMTAVSVPLIMQNRSDQALSSEAELVKEFILKAKNFAQNPENETAEAYLVRRVTSSQVEINRLVGGESFKIDQTLRLGQSQIANDFTPIIFKVPSGELSAGQNVDPVEVVVKSLSGRSQEKTIVASYPGVVNVR